MNSSYFLNLICNQDTLLLLKHPVSKKLLFLKPEGELKYTPDTSFELTKVGKGGTFIRCRYAKEQWDAFKGKGELGNKGLINNLGRCGNLVSNLREVQAILEVFFKKGNPFELTRG